MKTESPSSSFVHDAHAGGGERGRSTPAPPSRTRDTPLNLVRALEGLYARVPLGMRLGLGPMEEACAKFDHPERAFVARLPRHCPNCGLRICALPGGILGALPERSMSRICSP